MHVSAEFITQLTWLMCLEWSRATNVNWKREAFLLQLRIIKNITKIQIKSDFTYPTNKLSLRCDYSEQKRKRWQQFNFYLFTLFPACECIDINEITVRERKSQWNNFLLFTFLLPFSSYVILNSFIFHILCASQLYFV